MLNNTLKVLEFNKLKEVLKQKAASELGKQKIEALSPLTEIAEIKRLLNLCSEAKEIYLTADGFPLGGLKDIRRLLRKVSKPGAILEPEQLLHITGTARAARNVKRVVAKVEERCPNIVEIVSELPTFPELEEAIERCISPEGEISDDASPELRRIKNQVVRTRESIQQKLENTLRQNPKFIQESVITQRNDRYVIPVKQESRVMLSGVVQGQSASGATVFLEPMDVVENNNDLHRLSSEEYQEILRILRSLSDEVRTVLPELERAIEVLGELDFLGAKARLSVEFSCLEPQLNERGFIKLIRARHPLLELSLKEKSNPSSKLRPEKIIPTDIHTGDDFNTLVITGPNTGGKTVALKTVGLLTLMAQSGLHIPASDGSEISVFEKVCADIGDEQSIEQNLSTFSSHITKIVEITKEVNSNSLVLLDEIGAGTDPAEGVALGMSLLDYFHSLGAKTIVTTHYGVLKAYAHSNEGMANASMEFDWQTLLPTYRLQIGVPGSSNALKIADRLGMPPDIIRTAKDYMGTETVAVEDLIVSMEKEKRQLERERRLTQERRQSAAEIQGEYESLLEEFNSERKNKQQEAEREAAEIVKKARKIIENAVADIRQEQASKESIKQAHAAVAQLEEDLASKKHPRRQKPTVSFKVGDKVRVKSLNRFGEVVQLPDARGGLQVHVGNMNVAVPLSDVQKATAEYNKPKLTPSVLELQYNRRSAISTEINVRGQTVAEALDRADKFLDDALLSGVETVTIIHGKGTGALRNAITTFLKEHPQVADFCHGGYTEGNDGATIVTLKG